MVPPSFSTVELELLIYGTTALIFFGSFLVLLFSAIFGLGLARLLYVSGSWYVRKIHQPYSLDGTQTVKVVPHHSHYATER